MTELAEKVSRRGVGDDGKTTQLEQLGLTNHQGNGGETPAGTRTIPKVLGRVPVRDYGFQERRLRSGAVYEAIGQSSEERARGADRAARLKEKTGQWSKEQTQQLELTEQAKQREEGGGECRWDSDAVRAAHLMEQLRMKLTEQSGMAPQREMRMRGV